ncbi:MAG: hypothetical protein V4580_17885 [Bacteroidota bacterium]
MTQNSTGTWVGTIIYGKAYTSTRGKELYFELELVQQQEYITGIAKDTGGTGTSPDAAEINGTFTDNKIDFVKQYATSHYFTPNGTQFDRSQKGHLIHYTGSFNPEENTFSGTWRIKNKVWFLGLIPLTKSSGGTWTMKRK